VLWGGAAARAQTARELIDDPSTPGDVLTYGMGYGLQRYSPLDQIDTGNVRRLVPVWNFSLADLHPQENQPLLRDGLLYVASHQATYALDARSGWLVWKKETRYPKELYSIVCCGAVTRGLALYEGRLYRTLLDAHVQALDARTGQQVWRQKAAEFQDGYSMTGAPLVAAGVVITGVAGGDMGIRGLLDGWDARTGKHLWRTWTVPAPGEKGSETWPADDAWKHGGGATWISGSYDPELDLVYWGVGNPAPQNPRQRPGDNLFTDSVLAIRPRTGEIVWHYQFTPNDPYDFDGVNELVQATLTIDGRPRKVILQANRNGFFYVIDRATGELLRANPFVSRINWADGVDLRTGRPIRSEAMRRNIEQGEPLEVWPGGIAGKNYAPMSFHPGIGLVYLNAIESAMRYKPLGVVSWRRGTVFLGSEMSFLLPEGDVGHLRAVDPLTGKARWSVSFGAPANGGTLATAGNLVFTGDQLGRLIAFDARSGEELWSYKTASAIIAPPITYLLDGRQYVAVTSGVAAGMASALPHPDFDRVTRGGVLTVFRLFDERAPLPPSRPPAPAVAPATRRAGVFHGELALDERAAAGRAVYDRVCAACHGFGLHTVGNAVFDLREFPSEDRERFVRSVSAGTDQMPPFGAVLSGDEILSILDYVRAVQAHEGAAP
jgi:alcohol dehydrogenase (cytochrome c)